MATSMQARERRSTAPGAAVPMWCGLAFAPAFVVGFLFALQVPDNTDSDAVWQAWYADSGNRTGAIIGGYLLILSALLFLAFAAGLHGRLSGVAETTPVAYRLVSWTSVVVAVLIMVGAIQAIGIAGNLTFGGGPVPRDADILRQNLGYPFIGVTAAITAAVFIGAVAFASRRAGLFRPWLVVLSYVAAVLLLFAVIFFPLVALPLWVLVASIALLAGGSREHAPAPGETAQGEATQKERSPSQQAAAPSQHRRPPAHWVAGSPAALRALQHWTMVLRARFVRAHEPSS